MADPERHVEGEPGVRIDEPVAEQLGELAKPVPDRLRVDVQVTRRGAGVIRALQPGQQRLRQPVGLVGPQPPQRGEDLAAEHVG